MTMSRELDHNEGPTLDLAAWRTVINASKTTGSSSPQCYDLDLEILQFWSTSPLSVLVGSIPSLYPSQA